MKLSIELRSLVNESVTLLGEVIQRELGSKAFAQIESIRQQMTRLRESSESESFRQLQKMTDTFKRKSAKQRYEIAHAFTLMIEVMNVSENAYRSYRLSAQPKPVLKNPIPDSITYVLTAHPTEARSPQNVAIFHQIQNLLTQILESTTAGKKVRFSMHQKNDVRHLLEIAWRTPVVRQRSPKVKDEAETIYNHVFRDDVLLSLMAANDRQIPFRLHSWVGGDKDGHPGVDEKVLMQSMTLSRAQILRTIAKLLQSVRETLELVSDKKLETQVSKMLSALKKVKVLKVGDSRKILSIREQFSQLEKNYEAYFGGLHPQLRTVAQII